MLEPVQRAVAWLMNRVRVNHVEEGVRDGRRVFVKRRRTGAPILVWFANRFLALAHSGVRMFVRADEWIAWEIYCARLLYPKRPGVTVGARRAVIIPKVCGISLRALLRRNDRDLTTAFILAAREVRRAHQIQCSYFNGAWSHGDLHLDNIICDSNADRAVLIDFDTRHEPRNSATQRHSDDLTVLLLELIGVSSDRWRPLAAAFIEEYREHSVLSELDRQLSVPRGFGRLLWYARTQSSSTRRVEPRLQALREIIHQAVGREES
jgi:tRNA A-37 threonylcarbamoyl transferase component Bud32